MVAIALLWLAISGVPVKVLREFRLSVYFDGALERVTITHAHAAFTIRQTWLAALDEPAAVVLLDIDTGLGRTRRPGTRPQLEFPAGAGFTTAAVEFTKR